jgi:hypothetical protein
MVRITKPLPSTQSFVGTGNLPATADFTPSSTITASTQIYGTKAVAPTIGLDKTSFLPRRIGQASALMSESDIVSRSAGLLKPISLAVSLNLECTFRIDASCILDAAVSTVKLFNTQEKGGIVGKEKDGLDGDDKEMIICQNDTIVGSRRTIRMRRRTKPANATRPRARSSTSARTLEGPSVKRAIHFCCVSETAPSRDVNSDEN